MADRLGISAPSKCGSGWKASLVRRARHAKARAGWEQKLAVAQRDRIELKPKARGFGGLVPLCAPMADESHLCRNAPHESRLQPADVDAPAGPGDGALLRAARPPRSRSAVQKKRQRATGERLQLPASRWEPTS